MKSSRLLFLLLLLVLLGSVFSWWRQRYAAEAENLVNAIKTLKIERENQSLEKTLDRINDFFERTPVKLDSIAPNGDTLARIVNFSMLAESKSIQLFNNESGQGMEVYKPEGTIFSDSSERFKMNIRLDTTESAIDPDTMIRMELNFFEDADLESDQATYLEEFGDSLGISLKLISNRDTQIVAADTLGQWYLQASETTPVERLGKTNFRLIQEYIVIKDYRAYLLGGMWPELIAGLILILGLLAFFALVRRDMTRQAVLLEQKDRLLANVAHELKTPIATVGVALEALQDFGADSQPELRREYTAIARQELDRLNLLSERALHTLQLDAGIIAPNHETIELEALIQRAWSSLALKHQLPSNALCFYEAKPGNVSSSLVAREKPTVKGDRELLLHLFYNVLDNACKYGGEPLQIEVSCQPKGAFLQINISDNGPGVPGGSEEKIFEKFYRINDNRGHRVKGHGLGLTYARQIVLAHGGSIRYLASESPSIFSVSLPIQ